MRFSFLFGINCDDLYVPVGIIDFPDRGRNKDSQDGKKNSSGWNKDSTDENKDSMAEIKNSTRWEKDLPSKKKDLPVTFKINSVSSASIVHTSFKSRIAIIVVVFTNDTGENFLFARHSLECYAAHQKYTLYYVMMDNEPRLSELCPQKDKMFARHCVAAEILANQPQHEWAIFLDADTGVVNPYRRLEEYLPSAESSINIIFYYRIFNNEVACGSYIVRPCALIMVMCSFRESLTHPRRAAALFENKLFKKLTQQEISGRIEVSAAAYADLFQIALAEFFYPQLRDSREMKRCREMWSGVKTFSELSIFEVCILEIIEPLLRNDSRPVLRIASKGKSWIRDAWVTGSAWRPSDLFIHGWKKSTQDKPTFGRWTSPFTAKAFSQLDACPTPEGATLNWIYKPELMNQTQRVEKCIQTQVELSQKERRSILAKLADPSFRLTGRPPRWPGY